MYLPLCVCVSACVSHPRYHRYATMCVCLSVRACVCACRPRAVCQDVFMSGCVSLSVCTSVSVCICVRLYPQITIRYARVDVCQCVCVCVCLMAGKLHIRG